MAYLKLFFQLAREAFQKWSNDRASRLGAALAYYALFSLAPLMIVVIAIAGWVYGESAARGQIVGFLASQIGLEAAENVSQMLIRVSNSEASLSATLISIFLLLISSSGLFGQLRDALDTIWDIRPPPAGNLLGGIARILRDRMMAALMVILLGAILLAALALNTGMTAVSAWFQPLVPSESFLWQGGNLLIGSGLSTLLFAMIFKVLPDARVTWRVAVVGALVTSLLFNAVAYLIGLYLGYSNIISVFGVAGSFVAVLIWVFFSAQIIFYGAEFAQAYAKAINRPITPRRALLDLEDRGKNLPAKNHSAE